MDYDEYAQLESVSSPKMFEVTNGKQYLYYYGASHVNDPEHPMLPHIEEYWSKFLSVVDDKSTAVAVNEGGLRNPEGDRDTMIKRDGEGGLITYLATKENIEIISPEPNRMDVDKELLKEFSKDEIQCYYFVRVVNQYLQSKPEKSFEDYIKKILEVDKKESDWSDFDFSLENMKRIHTQIFGNEFNLEEQGFFYTVINPSRKDTVINAIARASSGYRDMFIIEKIIEKWGEGKSLFVVYGFSHGYRQEKALKTLLK